jgi:hypothetical protein
MAHGGRILGQVASVWHPIASMVTVAPRRSMVRSSPGMAVISFELPAVLTWPSPSPSSESHALTV